jgi:hypothetical protein
LLYQAPLDRNLLLLCGFAAVGDRHLSNSPVRNGRSLFEDA